MTGRRELSRTELGELAAIVGEAHCLADPEQLERYAHDETESLRFPPAAAVRPADAEEVAALLGWAHARGVPVTPRGAGTGLSGGALAVRGGVVLSLERLTRIREIDRRNLTATAEVGVTTAALQSAVEAIGLFYPPDPASRETATLGGNLAEDSAGPRSLKYGTTRRWVLGLEAVTARGERFSVGGKNRKDATGYPLTQLLVGSEGTLAVLTAATLRLIALPRATLTLVLPFPRLEAAAAAVESICATCDPAACELMEKAALEAVAALEPLPAPLVGSAAILLVELDGDDPEELLTRAATAEALARSAGGAEALTATESADQRRLWRVRRRIGEAVKHRSIYKEADTVVPRAALVELVEAARAAAGRHGLVAIVYGHAGDGNLHVNFLRGDLDEVAWPDRRDAAEAELFRSVVGLGGTISGEHGIGWVQKRYLPLALDPVSLRLQTEIRRLFDPAGILNPGKLFAGGDADAPER